MFSGSTIQYLTQKEINKSLWDGCISQAANGLVYAYSHYLDHMADNWDALVLNNYEAVMPLPWRKKMGIYYLYQPFLAAQLGLFGNDITAGLLQKFLEAVPSKFRLREFSLNHQNNFPVQGYNLYRRTNYILPLNQPYDVLQNNYRDNIKRNIRKSVQYGCHAKTGIDLDKIIRLAKQQSPDIPETDFENFKRLYSSLGAKTYGIFSAKDELLASCVFTFSHKRAYYILVGNHPNGRTLGASHALIDAFILDHAGKDLLLDFEGSDLRNLAFFYSSFGAIEEIYSAIRWNNLPWYIKWIKN